MASERVLAHVWVNLGVWVVCCVCLSWHCVVLKSLFFSPLSKRVNENSWLLPFWSLMVCPEVRSPPRNRLVLCCDAYMMREWDVMRGGEWGGERVLKWNEQMIAKCSQTLFWVHLQTQLESAACPFWLHVLRPEIHFPGGNQKEAQRRNGAT